MPSPARAEHGECPMLNITLTSEAAARLREIIEEEGEDACIRVRETKVGAG